MKKTASPRVLNDKYYDLIDNFVVSGLDKCDDRLPKVLCEHCRRTLLRFDKGDFSSVWNIIAIVLAFITLFALAFTPISIYRTAKKY